MVIRSKDSAATIAATLESARSQSVEVELILVDSGSRDETRKIAQEYCDRILDIPADSYTPGVALNLGSEAAKGEIVFALSSHCVLPDERWVERSLSHYEDPKVGGVSGAGRMPDGSLLREPLIQRIDEPQELPPDERGGLPGTPISIVDQQVRMNPAYAYWGFSAHACSWRRIAWESARFDETFLHPSDKEWAWRILGNGWTIVFDPTLWVPQVHRWRVGALSYFRRERREHADLAQMVTLTPYRASDALREWWRVPEDGRTRLFHLLNYRRLAGLAGKYVGLGASRK